MTPRIRLDRNELAGSFGDIGTDLPLIVGIILAVGTEWAASIFILFGLMQVLTGLVYGLPMPVQPLKAMAVLVITQQLSAGVLFGGGLAIGAIMLVLTVTGLLTRLAKWIPTCVVRGIQFGLGLALATLALGKYVPAEGPAGYSLAAGGFIIGIMLWGNRRLPAAIPIILMGAVYAAIFKLDFAVLGSGLRFEVPEFHLPDFANIMTGLVVLAIPQLPLSISNSVIATHRTVRDLFPERQISVRRIGLTYSLLNLVNPFLGGMPVCHGCGGLAGHYAFGGRTGGSVVIYGSIYLVIGLFFSDVFRHVVGVFPLAILGIILMFESITLLLFIRDATGTRRELMIALIVAVCAFTLPQGYVVGLLVGTALFYLSRRYPTILEGTPNT